MAALTSERNTLKLGEQAELNQIVFLVKGATTLFAGGLVDIDAGGYAVPGAAGVRTVGRCEATVNNTAGADGALKVTVRRGCFKYNNAAGGTAVTLANVGADCFATDDNTVANAGGHPAGKVIAVDPDGVWFQTWFY